MATVSEALSKYRNKFWEQKRKKKKNRSWLLKKENLRLQKIKDELGQL